MLLSVAIIITKRIKIKQSNSKTPQKTLLLSNDYEKTLGHLVRSVTHKDNSTSDSESKGQEAENGKFDVCILETTTVSGVYSFVIQD